MPPSQMPASRTEAAVAAAKRRAATLAAISAMPAAQLRGAVNLRSGGLTAIDYAVFARDVGTLTALLDAGADPNAADERRLTPLHNALSPGNWDPSVATALLDAGAAINAMSNVGTTPLDIAVLTENIEAVTMLLRRGADPDEGIEGSALGSLRLPQASAAMLRVFADAGKPIKPATDGTVVFMVASLMNHEGAQRSSDRAFFGNTIVVRARWPLKKDTEVTTSYGDDANLEHWNIKK